MSKYQITLTPVDKFFFGGDMTFKVGADKNRDFDNEQFSSYIIQSSMFPQQTSLLGMLRFLILRNAGEEVFKGNHIVDKTKAKELIGGRSFMVDAANDFKTVKGLNHVRIRRVAKSQSTDLEFAPLFKELDFCNVVSGTYNLNDMNIPSLTDEEYKAKEGLELKLTDGTNMFSLDDVFVKDRRVGINRDIQTGIVDDGALFKQISYRFNNKEANYYFVFEAEIDDMIPFESYSGQMVSVGGDNSQFVIGISKEIKNSQSFKAYSHAVCLLSPTFLKRAEAQTAKFAITRLMSFRFLTDRKDNRDDDKRSYHVLNSKLERSPRYELYAPGSVFYFENEAQKDTFCKLIDSKQDFRKIGYNEYK